MRISVAVLVNKDGDYVASHDADLLDELHEQHIGGSLVGLRTITVELEIPDSAPVIVKGTVPPSPARQIEMTVTED